MCESCACVRVYVCVCVCVCVCVIPTLGPAGQVTGHDSWPVESSLQASVGPLHPPAYLSLSLGGLCLRAPGAGHHCAENTAATGGLLLGQPRSSNQDFFFFFFSPRCVAPVHVSTCVRTLSSACLCVH